jgi:hypothetical protein
MNVTLGGKLMLVGMVDGLCDCLNLLAIDAFSLPQQKIKNELLNKTRVKVIEI